MKKVITESKVFLDAKDLRKYSCSKTIAMGMCHVPHHKTYLNGNLITQRREK